MKRLLWLDDLRNPYKDNWIKDYAPDFVGEIVWVKKYHYFVSWIEENGLPDMICFDHDLSDIHINKSTYKEKNGMDCARYVVDYCLDNNVDLPKWNIQSANPVGRDNINGLLVSFIKSRNKI